MLSDSFPELSQTFVIDQMASLLDSGLDVHMYADRLSTSGLVHARAPELLRHSTFADNNLAWRLAQYLPPWLRRKVQNSRSRRLARQAMTQSDIVVCHFGPSGLRAAAARRSPDDASIVTVFHGFDISSYLKTHGPRIYAPLFAKGAAFFAVNSLWVTRLVELGCPSHKVRLLRMGVDLTTIAYKPMEIIDGQPIQILTVGRLVEKKGTEFALRALAELKERRRELQWHFAIAGSGPLQSTIETLIHELGIADRVSMLGAISPEEVKRRLAVSHIFVLPSVTAANGDMEGIPVALMEAMAAGVSVVSTSHSGIPELIEHEASGLLAPERDVVALAAYLERVMTDEGARWRMLSHAREHVSVHFDQVKLISEFVAFVHDTLRRPS
jgi:colanic acid/amylovoran biosynthesis glycosyltransferase